MYSSCPLTDLCEKGNKQSVSMKAKNFKTSLLLINKGEGCVPLDRSTNRRKVIIRIDVRKK